MPVSSVRMKNSTSAGRRMFFMMIPLILLLESVRSGQMQCDQQQVDRLDADKGHDQTTHAVYQQIAAQQHGSPNSPVLDTLERQGDQGHDDERVENHGRQNGGRG